MAKSSSVDGISLSSNGDSVDGDDFSTIRNRVRSSSGSVNGNVPDEDWTAHGDYSSHMEEILGDDNDSEDGASAGLGDEGEDEGFLYTGKDAEFPAGGYQDQIRDVLDGDLSGDEGEFDYSLHSEKTGDIDESFGSFGSAQFDASASDQTESSSLARLSVSPPRVDSPLLDGSMTREIRQFIHPSVSRLRSTLVGSPHRDVSSSSPGSLPRDQATPSPSHLSSLSRVSSTSNLQQALGPAGSKDESKQDVFRWTSLRVINEHVLGNKHGKANAVLGSPILGSPTVLTANGLICIGTDTGRVFVFDFKQHLKCICGDENSSKSYGPVTALVLSHDHTFIAVGHAFGHIQLFDLKHPHTAARIVTPTTLAAVASGRQEGHIFGSRIVALGFIAGRHTAIVSADDQGLAFYHSLGKVLFIEASDSLRILGKYPEEELIPQPSPAIRRQSSNGSTTTHSQSTASPHIASRNPPRKAGMILSMSPLPLGTIAHPSDSYQLIAMLTPIKLVIVGLKPAPKTWFRRHREGDEENHKSRWRGCLSWFPSITTGDTQSDERMKGVAKKNQDNGVLSATAPLLAYSWGRNLSILRVSESRVKRKVLNKRTGKTENVDTGKVNFDDHGSMTFSSNILAIQWINMNQLVVFTDTTIEVMDIRTLSIVERDTFEPPKVISPTLSYTLSGAVSYQDSVRDIHHSIRAYKAKIFILEYKDVKVGTLLSWADRILSFVQDGDFLSAINLARDYYLGQAKGNKNGLPEDVDALRSVVGQKMSDLMTASARYAFSEDRMTDSTHVTPDNRGVDRTSLFEDLVTTCAKASISLDDYSFLFEDLFQYYDYAGISQIYLRKLESFVLDSSIHFIPPRITQRLVAMHEEDNNLDAAERIIWHIDPDCLDINQVITLCQKHHLHDALIYIYNTALQDYFTPVVELLALVREVQRGKSARLNRQRGADLSWSGAEEVSEHVVLGAYKIFAYLENILSGLTYPSGLPMDLDAALNAENIVYKHLFYGRSTVWPEGEGGKLVMTADEEGGSEPTYPYVRLLLRFDAEAFLHTLDIAFEQSYHNDETQRMNRQVLVQILLEVMTTPEQGLLPTATTFMNIFIARNVSIYWHHIKLPPSSLQNLLVGLAIDKDQSTREDRQLAAEYLLSEYTPHDSERIAQLFEDAGFYRILRKWYRQEHQWIPLLRTFVNDTGMKPDELFSNIEDTLNVIIKASKSTLPHEIFVTVLDSMPALLQSSIPQTALLIDTYQPKAHSKIINDFMDEDHKRFVYLRYLLGPPDPAEDYSYVYPHGPSERVDSTLRELYLTLLCKFEPASIIQAIKFLPSGFLDKTAVVNICENARIYNAVIWLLDDDSPTAALSKFEALSQDLTAEISETLVKSKGSPDLQPLLSTLDALYRMGIEICRSRSQQSADAEVPLEDLWYKLLSSQIHAVQSISSILRVDKTISDPSETSVIEPLRLLVQESLTSLVSVSSTKAVSFPRLFKRLVDSTSQSRYSGTPYSEFRNMLSSMLDSYRSEADLLSMSKRVLDSDFFDTLEGLTRARLRGWSPSSSRCSACGKHITTEVTASENDQSHPLHASFIVSQTGRTYHSSCFRSLNNQA